MNISLKGHFNRLEHQSQKHFNRISAHILPDLTLHLPAGIRDPYYRDIVGNVSTSKLRVAPRGSGRLSELNLRPRYPLLGGWNYSFTLGYDAPLADSAVYDKESGSYLVGVPIMTLIPGVVVDDAEVMIILPEGAT
jgi:oligosaccharyltransferase complex subunit alpha (ribophorin I)